MGKKRETILTILEELRVARQQTWVPPLHGKSSTLRLPPLLPIGNGAQLAATEKLVKAVSEYAKIVADNDPTLKSVLRTEELISLMQSAFGQSCQASIYYDEMPT